MPFSRLSRSTRYLADANPASTKLSVHPRTAVDAPTLLVGSRDLRREV
jgi:hypothetical protein